jgi:hypothetical protein
MYRCQYPAKLMANAALVASIVSLPAVATRIKACIAACHSGARLVM